MLPDRVLNPGPLPYEPGALPIALRGLAVIKLSMLKLMMSEARLKGNHQLDRDESSHRYLKSVTNFLEGAAIYCEVPLSGM